MKVQQGQNIIDMALMSCGRFEAAFDIAVANNLAITDDLSVGQELTIAGETNAKSVQYYKANRLLPATGITTDEVSVMADGGIGIGAWTIGSSFVVTPGEGIGSETIGSFMVGATAGIAHWRINRQFVVDDTLNNINYL